MKVMTEGDAKFITEETERAKKSIAAAKKRGEQDLRDFRIIRIETDAKTGKAKKVTMKRFKAKGHPEALKELKDYIRMANKQYKYYYDYASGIICQGKDGKRKEYDDFSEQLEAWRNEEPWYETVWWAIKRPFIMLGDLKYTIKWAFQRMFRGYDDRVTWNQGYQLFLDLIERIPYLYDSHGLPMQYVERARAEYNKKNPDVAKKAKGKDDGQLAKLYPDEVDKLASKLYKADLERLVLNCKLVLWYTNHGIEDKADHTVGMAKDYPLPIYPGTYDCLQYDKISQRCQVAVNSVMNYLKDNALSLWD